MDFPEKLFENDCPYCGAELEEARQYPTKCPTCQNDVYIRGRNYFTSDEATFYDWRQLLEFCGVNSSKMDQYKSKLNDNFDPIDLTKASWKILNDALPNTKDHWRLSNIYSVMAGYAAVVGEDPLPYKRNERKHELINYRSKHERITGEPIIVRIMNDKNHKPCDRCSELAQYRYSIEETLSQMPIPDECEHEDGCRCWYRIVDY